jgi:hypothetical protein
MKLLTTNSKLAKCEGYGYLAVGLELAPGKLAGRGEACPARGDCYKTCIFSSGFGQFDVVRKARIDRHRFMFNTDGTLSRDGREKLCFEIDLANERAKSRNLKLAVRLNVFSDYAWERIAPTMFMFSDVQFYDYTKVYERAKAFAAGKLPKNYHLVFSTNENVRLFENEERLLRRGEFGNKVSVTDVLYEDSKRIWLNDVGSSDFVDGELHDLTFLHKPGSIIVLSAKGKAGSRNPKPNKFLVH